MGSYVVLARKWRSAQFSDIVGQRPVVRTLMNAIKSERIHHAYLMTGSRGIGKTSIARIFAKAVRCENTKWEKGPDSQPWLMNCGECSSCKEISSGQGVDVIEIDGASNNGVDAVREIRENAKYLPSSGTRKIYIIDEVHMLTTQAFNALLKTLEEPPAHVIFILATTEPHKIPSTILSRCQRFDLKRIAIAEIQARIQEVARGEKIEIEAGAASLLARAAEGSMRDALSLFDQVIAYAGNQISTQAVRDSIGLISGQTLLGILDGIFSRKPLDALKFVEEAYLSGHDLKLLSRGLIEFLHGAILAKVGSETSGALELSTEEWSELRKIAAKRELEEIELFFQVFQNGTEWIARSPQPRTVIEVLIVKCASADTLIRLTSTPASSAPSSTGGSGGLARVSTAALTSQIPGAQKMQSAPMSAPRSPTTTVAAPTASEPARSITFGGAFANARPAQTTDKEEPVTVTYSGPRSWESFIDYVKQSKRPLLASVLEHAHCEKFPVQPDDEFVLCFKIEDGYFKEQLGAKVYLDQVQLITKEYFGVPKRLVVEVRDSVVSLAEMREKDRLDLENAAKQTVLNHPVITEARSLFGGEMGPIELISPNTEEGGSKTHEPARSP